jgi:hypothetical protein
VALLGASPRSIETVAVQLQGMRWFGVDGRGQPPAENRRTLDSFLGLFQTTAQHQLELLAIGNAAHAKQDPLFR